MKNEDGVHKVHDEFVAIVLGEIDLDLDDVTKERVHLACDVLCWVLDHDHNVAFADNLEKLRAAAAAHGYILERIDEPQARIARLTLAEISRANLERALLWHKHGGLNEWTVSDWAVAMAGEAGEVCDAIKKLRRIECAVGSNNAKQPLNRDAAIAAIAQEIGDTFIYLDLLAQRLGLNIEDCIRDTFNRISVRENMPQRLRSGGNSDLTYQAERSTWPCDPREVG